MDPNETLDNIYEAIRFLAEPTDDTEAAWGMVDQLVHSFLALDEWIRKGGFPPDAWYTKTQ